MSDAKVDLRVRTKEFALRVIRMYSALPKTTEAQVLGKQVLRSGTSVGANYRACCNARSRIEFIAKLGVVVEETDESVYWLEVLASRTVSQPGEVAPVLTEARELRAIFAKALGTARTNFKMTKSQNQITKRPNDQIE